MRAGSDRSRKIAKGKSRQRDDLLGIWLDLLKRFDNAPRRRAAKSRQAQRLRRPIQPPRLPWSGASINRADLSEAQRKSL